MWRRIVLVEASVRVNRTTLWKRGEPRLTRAWGWAQADFHPHDCARYSRIRPRGLNQSPACESWDRIGGTRNAYREGASRRLLATWEAAPKPHDPAPKSINNLRF